MQQSTHTWNFLTVGGVKRVNLESGADLQHLDQLDQKLWTALSCPVNGLEIDAQTLQLIDTDKDGQIRVPEILAAVKWATSVLNDADTLLQNNGVFPLSAINTNTEEGKTLYASAKAILHNLGAADSDNLSVEQTSNLQRIFAAAQFNGDGIITQASTNDADVQVLIQHIIEVCGGENDRGGAIGIGLAQLTQFFDQCRLFHQWQQTAQNNTTILPLGEATHQAYAAYEAVKSKIDDFFLRCKLADFDQEVAPALNLQASRVESISGDNLTNRLNDIAAYPLANVAPGKSLPLGSGVNPAWEDAINHFSQTVVAPLIGPLTTLTYEQWVNINQKLAAHQQWQSEKVGDAVAFLGEAYITQILEQHYETRLQALIQQDLELQDEANNMILVDQLVRYHRDLFTLLKNFVTFYDFYTPGKKAVFQAGTLYIDQRSCDLCIKVNDLNKHLSMAALSGMYLLYCECTSRSNNERMMIVAALTNGDIDNLVEGRNALFYDRDGMDWDATVVKIMDNPISIRQAFWSPYRKVSRFIENQINKFASAQDTKVTGDAGKHIEEFPAKAAAENKPAPFDVGKFVGIFAAIGLALGSIGTAITTFIAGFLALTWWKMPLALAGILLLISGPAMIMAYLKLRKRNLAPLLDANGWAINAGARINLQFGNLLTRLADLPAGARLNLQDPFTRKQRPVLPYVLFLAIVAGMVLYLLWYFKVW